MSFISEVLGGRVAELGRFPDLSVLLARIKDAYDPVDVVLYGSQARGEANSQSDWDIKVVVRDDASEQLFSPMYGWRIQEGSGVFADLPCIRLSEFKDDLKVANSAASHLLFEGVVLRIC